DGIRFRRKSIVVIKHRRLFGGHDRRKDLFPMRRYHQDGFGRRFWKRPKRAQISRKLLEFGPLTERIRDKRPRPTAMRHEHDRQTVRVVHKSEETSGVGV